MLVSLFGCRGPCCDCDGVKVVFAEWGKARGAAAVIGGMKFNAVFGPAQPTWTEGLLPKQSWLLPIIYLCTRKIGNVRPCCDCDGVKVVFAEWGKARGAAAVIGGMKFNAVFGPAQPTWTEGLLPKQSWLLPIIYLCTRKIGNVSTPST
eukprot:g8509.t1